MTKVRAMCVNNDAELNPILAVEQLHASITSSQYSLAWSPGIPPCACKYCEWQPLNLPKNISRGQRINFALVRERAWR